MSNRKRALEDRKTCKWVLDNGSVCGKNFSKFDSLRRHVAELHKNMRPFKCDQCSKTYGRKDYLDRHMKIHETEKDKTTAMPAGLISTSPSKLVSIPPPSTPSLSGGGVIGGVGAGPSLMESMDSIPTTIISPHDTVTLNDPSVVDISEDDLARMDEAARGASIITAAADGTTAVIEAADMDATTTTTVVVDTGAGNDDDYGVQSGLVTGAPVAAGAVEDDDEQVILPDMVTVVSNNED